MATIPLPVLIEQQIARYGQGRSLEDIIAEAVVNFRWDDEKYKPHEQLHDAEHALADLMRQTGRTREEIVHDALIEWVSDYQLAELADQGLEEGRDFTVPLQQVVEEYGLER